MLTAWAQFPLRRHFTALRDGVGPNAAIYVLNGPAPRDRGVLLGAKLKPVINSIEQARFWGAVAKDVREPPYTAIHIDTGMNRLGLTPDEVTELGRDRQLWKLLNPEWVMSHLACAPDASNPMNKTQLQRFRKAAAQFPLTPLSLANTAGIYLGKPYHFQMVRPGIGLYGGKATTKPEQEVSKPAATLLAPILQVRYVKAGETLGYNGTYEVNIVGRVSMDLTMIDATDAKLSVEVGGVVVFRGEHLEAEAQSAKTINYELLVRLGQRCRRDYWKPKKNADDTPKKDRRRR